MPKGALEQLLAEHFHTTAQASEPPNVPLHDVYAMAARGAVQFPQRPGRLKCARLGMVRGG